MPQEVTKMKEFYEMSFLTRMVNRHLTGGGTERRKEKGDCTVFRLSVTLFPMCLGRDLNPYRHCCPQDFKSCVSTNSTTKALSAFAMQSANIVNFFIYRSKKSSLSPFPVRKHRPGENNYEKYNQRIDILHKIRKSAAF